MRLSSWNISNKSISQSRSYIKDVLSYIKREPCYVFSPYPPYPGCSRPSQSLCCHSWPPSTHPLPLSLCRQLRTHLSVRTISELWGNSAKPPYACGRLTALATLWQRSTRPQDASLLRARNLSASIAPRPVAKSSSSLGVRWKERTLLQIDADVALQAGGLAQTLWTSSTSARNVTSEFSVGTRSLYIDKWTSWDSTDSFDSVEILCLEDVWLDCKQALVDGYFRDDS